MVSPTYERRFITNQAKLRRCIKVGGQVCKGCGLDLLDTPWLVAFHHRDKEDKVESISQLLGMNINSILSELSKCDLLCSPCHLKIHYNLELYQEYFDKIVETEGALDSGRFQAGCKIDEEELLRLAREGLNATEIGKEIGRGRRGVLRSLRRLELKTGEKLALSRREHSYNRRKISDEEIVSWKKAGKSNREICEAFEISSPALSKRIKKLIEWGEYSSEELGYRGEVSLK